MPRMAARPRSHRKAPHRLALYEQAVQHPAAEVAFIERVWRRARQRKAAAVATGVTTGVTAGPSEAALLLREDFSGSAAIARAWVASHPDRQAMAVDRHEPTLRWAWRAAKRELDERADDLHLVCGDVTEVRGPRVDVVAALNFSTFIYHDRAGLRAYFRAARRALKPGGVFVMDLFGGPGAQRVGTQRRNVTPDAALAAAMEPFDYVWEQRSFDAMSHRIDCRIHFEMPGRRLANAFRYDWRLWTLPEVLGLMVEAGLADPTAWCDRLDGPQRGRDGRYRPLRRLPAREDFVAYVSGHREA